MMTQRDQWKNIQFNDKKLDLILPSIAESEKTYCDASDNVC